jgi:1-acyl-sn-glycerol-3-phosphate acyltransferase
MKLLRLYRVLAKWFSFFIFGAGTLLLVSALFPPMRLLLHPRRRFQKYARKLVSLAFRFFVGIMTFIGIVELHTDDGQYAALGGKIVAANHPSLLDVVMLISLIPNADCIVRASLSKTIVGGIIRQLYIPNSGDPKKLIEDCIASIKNGNCIIIFPEGTRTARGGRPHLKKGAVRIALTARCPIVPVQIRGSDKYGLGKKDPWTGLCPEGKYIYRLERRSELVFAGSTALDVKRGTETLYRALGF